MKLRLRHLGIIKGGLMLFVRSVKGQQIMGVVDTITNQIMQKEYGYYSIICSIIRLFLLVTVVAVMPVSVSTNNCIDIDCLKERDV